MTKQTYTARLAEPYQNSYPQYASGMAGEKTTDGVVLLWDGWGDGGYYGPPLLIMQRSRTGYPDRPYTGVVISNNDTDYPQVRLQMTQGRSG